MLHVDQINQHALKPGLQTPDSCRSPFVVRPLGREYLRTFHPCVIRRRHDAGGFASLKLQLWRLHPEVGRGVPAEPAQRECETECRDVLCSELPQLSPSTCSRLTGTVRPTLPQVSALHIPAKARRRGADI